MEITIAYVDDTPDPDLSEYLETIFLDRLNERYGPKVSGSYIEHNYRNDDSYAQLLQSQEIRLADVVIIDSQLFTNETEADKRISGELIKNVLKGAFPYIEVLVMTQHSGRRHELSGILAKYDSSRYEYESPISFYSDDFEKALLQAVERVLSYRFALEGDDIPLQNDPLLDKIERQLGHDHSYSSLSDEKIDSMIRTFEQIKEMIINAKK